MNEIERLKVAARKKLCIVIEYPTYYLIKTIPGIRLYNDGTHIASVRKDAFYVNNMTRWLKQQKILVCPNDCECMRR